MLAGNPPFEAPRTSDTYKRILRVDLRFPSSPALSIGARDLVQQVCVCVCVCVCDRCSWAAAGAEGGVVQLLKRSPRDRLPLASLLNHPWILQHAEATPTPAAPGGLEQA